MVQLRSGQVYDDTVPQRPTTTAGGDALPAGKRRRREGADPSPKRRRRKREALCQLNLDVLFLIAEYIHPMDLLNLARTCKSLRELLMDKSSEFVWKAARLHIGLPDCPADLDEPQYANLVFCARCHGCGKSAKTVIWLLRRRYCKDCKQERLCELASCDKIIRDNDVLPTVFHNRDGETLECVDKDQMESFLNEYHKSTDKEHFLTEKRAQKMAIDIHTVECEEWQYHEAARRRDNLALRRDMREQSIIEKLEQHGYKPEVSYFGSDRLRHCYKAVFRTSKALTDREWNQMWPEWRKIMDDLRSQRISSAVYPARRIILADAYGDYLSMSDEPTFDLLPHLAEVASFGPFRDIIRAPEGTQMGDEPFAAAFAQLPDFIPDWRQLLDAQLAELVKIPSSSSPGKASSTEALPADTNKLDLACAQFTVRCTGPWTRHNVFYASMCNWSPQWRSPELEWPGPMRERFHIEFLYDALRIVQICGLEPSIATADDMDRRNARLVCLRCKDSNQANIVMNWRVAILHIVKRHTLSASPWFETEHWQLLDDAHIDAIQGVEQSIPELMFEPPSRTRCLLCRPHVGDASYYDSLLHHLIDYHKLDMDKVKEGVHYEHLGVRAYSQKVEMAVDKDSGQVAFRLKNSIT